MYIFDSSLCWEQSWVTRDHYQYTDARKSEFPPTFIPAPSSSSTPSSPRTSPTCPLPPVCPSGKGPASRHQLLGGGQGPIAELVSVVWLRLWSVGCLRVGAWGTEDASQTLLKLFCFLRKSSQREETWFFLYFPINCQKSKHLFNPEMGSLCTKG